MAQIWYESRWSPATSIWAFGKKADRLSLIMIKNSTHEDYDDQIIYVRDSEEEK